MPLRQPHERISHSLKFTYKKAERLPFREAAPLFIFTANLLLPLLTSLAFEHRFSLPFGEGGAALRRTVTDEGSPLTAGLTAVRSFEILWLAAEPPRLPLRRELSR